MDQTELRPYRGLWLCGEEGPSAWGIVDESLGVVLNERSQPQSATCCLIPFTWNSGNDRIVEMTECGCQGLRVGADMAMAREEQQDTGLW